MDQYTLPNISIIGSGRVAKSLGTFFLSKGVTISGIYSRNKETGEACAALLNVIISRRLSKCLVIFIWWQFLMTKL